MKEKVSTKVSMKEEQMAKEIYDELLLTPFYNELEDLKKQVSGDIILPCDGERYQECRRRPFNQAQRSYPYVIARVKNTQDVAACVKFANKHKKYINLCVASGAHSTKCMMARSFIIDLCTMNKASLDLTSNRVQVGGGAYLEEVDKVLKPHNMGVPVGTYPETGVGGLALGGGFGWLARILGFTVDNIVEVETVLSTGEVVVANDENQYSDLIWGFRGGGGNFGVVTKFTLQAHKLPTYCIAGATDYHTPTLASAVEVTVNYDKLVDTLSDYTIGTYAFSGGSQVCSIIWAHFGEQEDPSKIPELRAAQSLGGEATKVDIGLKERSYHSDLQRILTQIVHSGHIYHTLIQFGTLGETMPEKLWTELLTFTRKELHPALEKATVLLSNMGGGMANGDPQGKKTCISGLIRKSRYFAVLEILWKPEYEDGMNAAREWARGVTGIIKPYSNEAIRYAAADAAFSTAEVIEREKDAMGYRNDTYNKLRQLKKKYDPNNIFKNNVNIAPAE